MILSYYIIPCYAFKFPEIIFTKLYFFFSVTFFYRPMSCGQRVAWYWAVNHIIILNIIYYMHMNTFIGVLLMGLKDFILQNL